MLTDDDDQVTRVAPSWRFHWMSPVVELARIPRVLAFAFASFATEVYRMADGIYDDLAAHHNWQRQQIRFADDVRQAIEAIPTMEI